jgi:hypothetical protein
MPPRLLPPRLLPWPLGIPAGVVLGRAAAYPPTFRSQPSELSPQSSVDEDGAVPPSPPPLASFASWLSCWGCAGPGCRLSSYLQVPAVSAVAPISRRQRWCCPCTLLCCPLRLQRFLFYSDSPVLYTPMHHFLLHHFITSSDAPLPPSLITSSDAPLPPMHHFLHRFLRCLCFLLFPPAVFRIFRTYSTCHTSCRFLHRYPRLHSRLLHRYPRPAALRCNLPLPHH